MTRKQQQQAGTGSATSERLTMEVRQQRMRKQAVVATKCHTSTSKETNKRRPSKD